MASDETKKRKQKGGAEKERDRKRKLLEKSTTKCQKISDIFSRSHASTSAEDEEFVFSVDPKFTMNSDVTMTDDLERAMADETEKVLSQGNPATLEPPEENNSEKSATKNQPPTNDTSFTEACDHSRYFKRPEPSELPSFLKFHPQQSTKDPVLRNAFSGEGNVNRQWLSYDEKNSALFCSVCLAFAKSTDYSAFIKGYTDRRHFHQRIQEHEKSKSHVSCAGAYLMYLKKLNIEHLVSGSQLSLRSEQVKKRRQVMERIIDIIKFIGKRCLSYRGKAEASYTLENEDIDHGNFLELILLLSKYDICLQQHVQESIEKSKTQHLRNQEKQGASGRGNLLTMISKTSINYIIETIGAMIRTKIAEDVIASGMFTIQIDTTQDVSTKDQCSIVIRYVLDKVYERLFAVKHNKSGTGENMCKLLILALKESNINVSQCIGNATDGAANMQGEFKGLNAWLNKESPGQLHMWCLAHVLNLIISDSTSVTVSAASLFSLLNDIAVFLRDSYQRSDIWDEISKRPHHKKLGTIGATRWWSKHSALKKVFGSFSNKNEALYVEAISTLQTIINSTNLKPHMRAQAHGFLKSLLEYETVLTAHIYLRIFEETTPLSNYLQTSGLDILKAHNMVRATHDKLKKYSRDFQTIKKQADQFVQLMNLKLETSELELRVEEGLPCKVIRKKKIMPGEKASDEVITDSFRAYECNTHNVILDTAIESIDKRFSKNEYFYADLSFLDPRNFNEVKNNPEKLKAPIMEELSSVLVKFDKNATAENIRSELASFISNWDNLKLTTTDFYETKKSLKIDEENYELDELDQNFTIEENELDEDFTIESCASCKDCSLCCYNVLLKYNLFTSTYKLITLAYKYLLTLSISQVSCERSFSTLKNLKTRLRSQLSQEHLEPLMLMACERDILKSLDASVITDKVADRSELLRKNLIC